MISDNSCVSLSLLLKLIKNLQPIIKGAFMIVKNIVQKKITKNFFCMGLLLLVIPLSLSAGTTPLAQHSQTFAFSAPKECKPLDCLMVFVGNDDALEKLSKVMQFDLEFSDQLKIDLKRASKEPSSQQLEKLYERGTTLYFHLKKVNATGVVSKGTQQIEVTAKDPSSSEVLFQKTFAVSDDHLVFNAHVIADALMPILTGGKGPLLSTFAYCKQIAPGRKVVCIADYAGRKERVVVPDHRINVAPRWHTQAPVLFFSQFTRSNCALKSLDIRSSQQRVICSYDGLNMQPSFSGDGGQAVLCLSSKGNSELYLYDQATCKKLKKRVFKQLTNNGANNVSPSLTPNGDVIFCSDYQTGSPQIYLLDGKTSKTRRLTNGQGYCTSPSWCAKTNAVVYTRRINDTLQLFTLDLNTPLIGERQLTYNEGDKVEPVWSECGKYVAFSYLCRDREESPIVPQIAVLNAMSGKVRIITAGNEPKSYPAWVNAPFYHL